MLSKKKVLTFVSTFAVVALWSASVFAQGGDVAIAGDNGFTTFAWMAIAAGFGLGIAAFGGGIGQGRAAAAALEGIARNPGASGKILTPLILGLALIESLVIYVFVISILLVTSIDAEVVSAAIGG